MANYFEEAEWQETKRIVDEKIGTITSNRQNIKYDVSRKKVDQALRFFKPYLPKYKIDIENRTQAELKKILGIGQKLKNKMKV